MDRSTTGSLSGNIALVDGENAYDGGIFNLKCGCRRIGKGTVAVWEYDSVVVGYILPCR